MGTEDEAMRWWITGISDGESFFRMYRHPKGRSWTFMWGMKLRADDSATLEKIQGVLGGVIYDNPVPPEEQRRRHNRMNTKPAKSLQVFRREEVENVVQHFKRYPLQSKKARDFEVWSAAATEWFNAPMGLDVREGQDNRGLYKRKPQETFERMTEYHLLLAEVRAYPEAV